MFTDFFRSENHINKQLHIHPTTFIDRHRSTESEKEIENLIKIDTHIHPTTLSYIHTDTA